MKIGIVCPYSLVRGGGVQEHVLAQAAELNRRGHSAKIITLRPRGYKDISKKDCIFLGSGFDFRSPMHTTTQLSASISTDEIDVMLANEGFDILHFHEPWQPLLSRQVLTRSTCPNVATFHAKVLETMMARSVMKVVTPYTKSILEYIDTITAVSPAAADYVKTLTDKPITYVPNGINLSKFHEPRKAKAADDHLKILYIGRLERRKGVKYLLKAFKLVSADAPNIELLIAGEGPDRKKLEYMAAQLGLNNVKFLGYVSEKQKINLLRDSDLFVSPAIHGESFGIVLLEAMASGLPTVAADNDGYSHLMQGLGSLSLVNVYDTLEFARRIQLILFEPTLRKLWRDWARGYVKQFSYEKVVDQYENVYKATLANNHNL